MLIKIEDYVFYRSIECPDSYFSNENLKAVHDVVYNKPYDINPIDWVEAFLQVDFNPQKTDRFWCSALVGCIYSVLFCKKIQIGV